MTLSVYPIKTLLDVIITTAVTGIVTTGIPVGSKVSALTLRSTFTFGSGGTNGKFWVQTSFDDGVTWVDITAFAVAVASLDRYTNLSALTPVLVPAALTDGTLADDTSKDGLLGGLLRVKYTTTGTYAGSTRMLIKAVTKHFNERL